MAKYRKKMTDVSAIQFNADSVLDVMGFLTAAGFNVAYNKFGAPAAPASINARVPSPVPTDFITVSNGGLAGPLQLGLGMWAVLDNTGALTALGAADFAAAYEPRP